jgi:hypothetical protein
VALTPCASVTAICVYEALVFHPCFQLVALQESDSDGVPDDELAARAWDNYRLRNDSHIVDHFQVGCCFEISFSASCVVWSLLCCLQ